MTALVLEAQDIADRASRFRLAARRHNEQVKLFAMRLDNGALALLITGWLAPSLSEKGGVAGFSILFIVLGLGLYVCSHFLLLLLRSEDQP